MRIGQLADRSGVKLETIRYYERVGLLPPPPRTASGYREYQPDHLQRLVFLRRSRQLGFSIKDVQDLLNLASEPDRVCKDVTHLAATHIASVKAKIRELQRLRRALEKLVSACPGKARMANCGILEALTEAVAGTSEAPVGAREAQTRGGRARARHGTAPVRSTSVGRTPLRPV